MRLTELGATTVVYQRLFGCAVGTELAKHPEIPGHERFSPDPIALFAKRHWATMEGIHPDTSADLALESPSVLGERPMTEQLLHFRFTNAGCYDGNDLSHDLFPIS